MMMIIACIGWAVLMIMMMIDSLLPVLAQPGLSQC